MTLNLGPRAIAKGLTSLRRFRVFLGKKERKKTKTHAPARAVERKKEYDSGPPKMNDDDDDYGESRRGPDDKK